MNELIQSGMRAAGHATEGRVHRRGRPSTRGHWSSGMTLPLLISVPHAGLRVPPEAERFCKLTETEIAKDGDEGAAEIYTIESEVECYVTTDIARAIVDLNRAEDDRRKDGGREDPYVLGGAGL